jgi:hypothetical protein
MIALCYVEKGEVVECTKDEEGYVLLQKGRKVVIQEGGGNSLGGESRSRGGDGMEGRMQGNKKKKKREKREGGERSTFYMVAQNAGWPPWR